MRLIRPLHAAFAVAASLTAAPASAQQVLGQLGEAVDSVAIHARASGSSHVYYWVKADQYLVIRQTTNPHWMQVLMTTGAYGYIPAEDVLELPYRILQKPSRSEALLASRGGAARGGGSAIANYSQEFIGTPYKWGGEDLSSGIDCSAFVKKMYGSIGESLPRTAAEQALVGETIGRFEDLRAGDRLYFWDKRRNMIGHTGIYLGGGIFIHASSSHHGVVRDYLGKPGWLSTIVCAKRGH